MLFLNPHPQILALEVAWMLCGTEVFLREWGMLWAQGLVSTLFTVAYCQAGKWPGLPGRGAWLEKWEEGQLWGGGYLVSGTANQSSFKFDTNMLVSLLKEENAKDICVIKIPSEMKYTDTVWLVTL